MKLTPPPRPPRTPRIKVVRIDPWRRRCVVLGCDMHPAAIQEIVGKKTMANGKLGTKGSVEIMLAGDQLPQIPLLTSVEPEYQVLDEVGRPGPVLHGFGIVYGFLPNIGKGASTPVDAAWVAEHVIFLGEPNGESEAPGGAAMEGEPGHEGEAPKSREDGVGSIHERGDQ